MSCGKVVIIGSGISGLCSALILQKKGIKAEIYDQERGPYMSEAGMILGGNALKALDYIGVGDQVRQASTSSNNCTIFSEWGKVIVDFSYHSAPEIPKFFFILHNQLQKILTDSLFPGTIHYSKKLIDFTQENKSIDLAFSDGTTTNADYLLACDGGHSFIRSRLLSKSIIQFSGLVSWNGILEMDEEMNDYGYSETWGPRGSFGIAPMPNRKIFWYAVKKCEENNGTYEKWNSIDLLFNFFSYHEPIQSILEKTKDEGIKYQPLYELTPLKQYLFGGILLIGDSAHVAPPNLGQGVSQAIEDAMYLAKCIESAKPLNECFKRYERDRINRTRQVFIEMKRLRKMAQVNKPALCSIRDKFLKLVPNRYHQNKLKGIFEIEPIG